MKLLGKKNILIAVFFATLTACSNWLDVSPEDGRVIDEDFWKTSDGAYKSLYGIYKVMHDRHVYGYGGGLDACTPSAYQWAHWEGRHQQIGNGSINATFDGFVTDRWKSCYKGIYRVNYFLENIDKAPISDSEKQVLKAESYFLRAIFYALLVDVYGGVPLVLETITVTEARGLKRYSKEEIYNQIHEDYDLAIESLPIEAEIVGRAAKGAAYGMKMRAYLYQNNWDGVLNMVEKIEGLGMYHLFNSYQGLFQLENQNNEEVIFDVQFMAGPFSQGSVFDRYFQPQNVNNGIDGSNSVAPTQHLVDEYETIDGTAIDPDNPYDNRDPRLDFTILRPGAYFQEQLYPVEIQNHTGQKVGFGFRKYTIENQQVIALESPLNFIVLRYADVLLAKAEALIEKGTNINEAIGLINRIRTERNDVTLTPIPNGLSQEEAREKLRKERRIEFALEGLYWSDIKRWNIGADIYPVEITDAGGEIIEIKFAGGYNEKDNLLPIPDSEISLNPNIEQNPDY